MIWLPQLMRGQQVFFSSLMKSGHNHRIMSNLFFIYHYFRCQLFQRVCGPILNLMIVYRFFWMRLMQNFVNQTKTQWINVCFKPHVLYIFCSKHLCIKHGYQPYNFGFIDKIVSQSHFKYTVNLTFQYIQSRFVAMIHRNIFAMETAVVLWQSWTKIHSTL